MNLHDALTTAASVLRLRRIQQERRFSATGELDDPIIAGCLDNYQSAADLIQRVADNLTDDGHKIVLNADGFSMAV